MCVIVVRVAKNLAVSIDRKFHLFCESAWERPGPSLLAIGLLHPNNNTSSSELRSVKTMSGPLVPSSPAAGFSQQGQVDWVELSSKSVQFSVAVLSRLSRAGIDTYTLHVSRAICLGFALDPIAQGRIVDAIFRLKKYSSYGNLIWFGFGVKQVVNDLAETEEGLTLVALCAALTTTYDSTYSARVLRELFVLQKAPESLTPALRQWKAIVELCSGILTDSHFVLILNGFRRLIVSHSDMPDLKFPQCPTPPTDLAKAILTLARVSSKNLVNVTFTGGLDCAWLAALGEWVLSLDVGIVNPSGLSLHRSRLGTGVLPQVTVFCSDETTTGIKPDLIVSKALIVPRGRAIIHTGAEINEGPRPGNYLNWRSPWSSILHDTFHGKADSLLTNETGRQFALYLECMSVNPLDPLSLCDENRHGRRFLAFASKQLPEVAVDLWFDLPVATYHVFELEKPKEAIRSACSCCLHGHRQQGAQKTCFCLEIVAETIFVYLWSLHASSIDDDVYPSVTGLANLYSWVIHARADRSFDPYLTNDLLLHDLSFVLHVLTGLPITGRLAERTVEQNLASAGGGLCVYGVGLEDPLLPPGQITKYRVVRGYIAYSGARFSSIRDLAGGPSNIQLPYERLDYLLHDSPPLSIDMIVQESNDETQLELAYLVNYIDACNVSCTLWLHLGTLVRNFVEIMIRSPCAGNCKPLDETDTSIFKRATSLRMTCKLDMEAVGIAERMIHDIRHPNDIWILITSTEGEHMKHGMGHSRLLFLFIDDPIRLYLFFQHYFGKSFSIMPFSKCLSCITRLGCSKVIIDQVCHPEVTLVTPNNKTSIFRWEIQSRKTDRQF